MPPKTFLSLSPRDNISSISTSHTRLTLTGVYQCLLDDSISYFRVGVKVFRSEGLVFAYAYVSVVATYHYIQVDFRHSPKTAQPNKTQRFLYARIRIGTVFYLCELPFLCIA